MILLNINIPKKSYSQERADRVAAEKAIMAAKKERFDFNNPSSLCCKATIRTLYQPKAEEDEARTIRICTACNTEAPVLKLFDDWDKIPDLFIKLHNHKTNNKNAETI